GVAAPAASLAAIITDLDHGVPSQNVEAAILASGGNYASTNAIAAWVHSVFRDLLGREPTTDETSAAVTQIGSGAITMPQLAAAIQNSLEARILYVRQQFIKYLGRDPGPDGAAPFAGYARRQDVVALLVSSPEYFARNGGTTAGYVQAAYRDIGGISPLDATDLNFWVDPI